MRRALDPNSTYCNIERVPLLSVANFRRLYKRTAPVVFTMPEDTNAAFRERTSLESLLNGPWASLTVTLSSANSYSHDKVTSTMAEYLRSTGLLRWEVDSLANETFTLFGDHYSKEWDEFLSPYVMPVDSAADDGILSFGVAGARSGVSFHTHGAAISETLHGRKRWFLTPPDEPPQFNGDESQLQWLNWHLPHLPAEARPLQCTVSPGEAIYIPGEWHHATFNLDPYNAFVSTFTHEKPLSLDDV